MKILLATQNQHKVREMTALLDRLDLTILTTAEFPGLGEVEEDGETYEANAILKAHAWAAHARLMTLADDSGLEVDAMGGRPGLRSSRYAPTNEERIAGILRELQGVEEPLRSARFVCVMALAWPDGRIETRRGVCEGRIGFEPAGSEGFGYDPIFFLPDRGVTMAELADSEKSIISHRARAAQQIRQLLNSERAI
jgi:XTP/dITP diphosphohydrolase